MSALEEYIALWSDHGLSLDPALFRVSSPSPAPRRSLDAVREWIGDCRRCGLYACRNKIVVGEGSPEARLMFVGEGPGADEDAKGLPFLGPAGELLDKIILAMGLARSQVYLANVVKCRPPQNRQPTGEEVQSCAPFLKAQIEALSPKVIVALGNTAASAILGSTETMASLRGRFHALPWSPSILVMPTYHPAYLLRSPEAKKLVWEDMKKVMQRI